jgi:transglutaminase/protease-like cytokinesis protein 3
MDMLGIECITVRGTSLNGEEEHMWNMVRLDDGEWYCVDVTWNDTLSETAVEHKYFNVTSDFMSANDHQWNTLRVPAATSEKYM